VSAEGRFTAFLRQSLDALRREVPAAYAQLCAHLDGQEVLLAVTGDEVAVRATGGTVCLGPPSTAPTARIRTSRDTILALIDAELTWLEALQTDALVLQGAPADVLRCHDALLTYVHGAVRAASFPTLLAAYRTGGDPTIW